LIIENTRVIDASDYSPDEESDFVTRVIPPACAGLRLDQALARLFPEHSRSRLQAWLKVGRIRMNDCSPDACSKVWGGERLEVDIEPPAEQAAQAEDIRFPIVFEDDCLLVIDKPAGLVVHPGNGNWSGTLMNGLLAHDAALAAIPRAGIVHRLDKDTSGLLVVAKTLAAQTALIRQLQERSVGRHYLALAHGTFDHVEGEVDAPIARHPTQRTRMAVVASGRAALTRYRVHENLGTSTLLECRLATGRTHQIRVHMAHLGYPLVGDPVYGRHQPTDPRLAAFPRQALHAFRLGLIHPASGKTMQWFAPLPADLAALLRALGSRGMDNARFAAHGAVRDE
jgi:23S rRNA pseudouridine1911/1915/1917 synthase